MIINMYLISPNNLNTFSSGRVMRISKSLTWRFAQFLRNFLNEVMHRKLINFIIYLLTLNPIYNRLLSHWPQILIVTNMMVFFNLFSFLIYFIMYIVCFLDAGIPALELNGPPC